MTSPATWFFMVRKIGRWEDEDLPNEEATVFCGVAARAIFLSPDCPELDLQFPVKQMSREMAKPMVGTWKRMNQLDI